MFLMIRLPNGDLVPAEGVEIHVYVDDKKMAILPVEATFNRLSVDEVEEVNTLPNEEAWKCI